ncbi:MAG: pyrroline-5-carboxylate reductase [Phycisphaerae bacterium]|nr:pyrroline-5-carboxylate reductase [Phycisphaerae bacterium]
MATPDALVVIGGGHMGSAIVRGVVRAGFLEPGRVVVAEPDAARHPLLALEGCRTEASAGTAIGRAWPGAAVLLAVKPQVFPRVAREIGRALDGRLVVSVMAGVRSGGVAQALGGRVVRVMPNLGVSIGVGMSAIAPGPGATGEDEAWARGVFETLGRAEAIDESLMDAFTAVAGSGPAYLFYLAEGMVKGAVEAGMEPEVADRVVRQTLLGAAELLAGDEGLDAARWRARVTSKGGTTAAAVEVLDSGDAMNAIVRAIVAARDRGAELSAD